MSKLFICENKTHVEELIHHCLVTKVASVDFETTSFEYYRPSEYPLILGTSFQPGSSWILPLAHKESPFKKTWKKHFKVFGKEVIENPDIIKVAWNLKFEYKWFMAYDIIMKGRLFDGMLAKYCLDEERPHDLKDFAATFFPQYANYEEKISPKGIKDKDKIKWADKPFLPLCEYCGIDADITNRGMIIMEKKLIDLNFYNLFRNLLMMATRVLGESEYRGLRVNRSYLEDLMGVYKIKIETAESAISGNRALLRYERKYKKYHLRKLISKVEEEIENLQDSDAKNTDTLIRNREKKIQNYLQGTFSNKDRYEGFNPASPKQLGEFLFHSKFGLKLKPLHKTESGADSTDEETLEYLKPKDKTGFLDSILTHRGLVKLDSTYISGIHPRLDQNNYVHAGFLIHGTVTGRLSCTNPNLQNIPRDTTSADIKQMFIPPPGYVLLEVDYGQAELRLIAEAAKDEIMIDLFRKGYNIHVATACKINGGIEQYEKVKAIIKKGDAMSGEELSKPENKKILFWLKQKKRGKSINFSIVYGQTAKALSEELECSEREAQDVIDRWYKEFPGVERWMARQRKFVHKNGYVMNMFGRKRRLYNIDSPKYGVMLKAERDSINAPIQGASSDFGVFSTIVIREMILEGSLPIDMQQAYTVHDSIGYYIRPKDIHWVVPILKRICNNPDTIKYFGFKLKHVEMKVSAEVGIESWGALNEYEPSHDYVKMLKQWEKKRKSAA